MLSRPPLLSIPSTVTRLLHGRLDKTGYLTEIQAKTITVERPAPGVVNIDGDPVIMDASLEVRMVPQSLSVMVLK
jgi:diacylglycerol kinase family enzyme